MSGKEYATPFPLLQAASLLSHRSRISKFRKAIEKIVKPDDYVIDLGTGSGILAILAARIGARVTAIDTNAESLRYAQNAAEQNGVSNRIEFLHTHFSDFKPDERADVVICEMLSSVMLIEQQIPASLHAIRQLLKDRGSMIPMSVDLYAVVVENEILWNRFQLEDLTFPRIPQTADRGQSSDLADVQELAKFDLSSVYSLQQPVDRLLQFRIVQDGKAHGIIGMFESHLTEDIVLTMEDGWRELFLPFQGPIEVNADDILTVRISFAPGEYDSLLIDVL